MALTNDKILAGFRPQTRIKKAVSGVLVAQRDFSFWYSVGRPGPAALCAAGVNGEALTSFAGQLPMNNPAAGVTTSRIGRLLASTAQAGTLRLLDRLWHNSGLSVTSTSLQTLDSGTLNPRDDNGGANGVGVFAFIEVSASLGAGAPVFTITYTNSDGVPNRTAVNVIATAASSLIGTMYEFGLQSGDVGIRKITGFQSNLSATSGSFSLVLAREIASVEITSQLVNAIDFMTGGCPESFPDSVRMLAFTPTTTATTPLSASLIDTVAAL